MKKSLLILSFMLCSSCNNSIAMMIGSPSTATPQTSSPSPSSTPSFQTTPSPNSQPLTPEAVRARFLQRLRAKSLDLTNLESVNEIAFMARHAQQKSAMKKNSSHNSMLNQQAETTLCVELMQLYALTPETPKSSDALEQKE